MIAPAALYLFEAFPPPNIPPSPFALHHPRHRRANPTTRRRRAFFYSASYTFHALTRFLRSCTARPPTPTHQQPHARIYIPGPHSLAINECPLCTTPIHPHVVVSHCLLDFHPFCSPDAPSLYFPCHLLLYLPSVIISPIPSHSSHLSIVLYMPARCPPPYPIYVRKYIVAITYTARAYSYPNHVTSRNTAH